MSSGSSGSSAFLSRYFVIPPRILSACGSLRAKSATSKSRNGLRDLEAVHHAGTVDLGQDAVLKIEFRIELQGAIHQIWLPARIPGLHRLGIQILRIDRICRKIARFREVPMRQATPDSNKAADDLTPRSPRFILKSKLRFA